MPVFISYPLEASTEKYFLLGVILIGMKVVNQKNSIAAARKSFSFPHVFVIVLHLK
jgi:hypothetical protein